MRFVCGIKPAHQRMNTEKNNSSRVSGRRSAALTGKMLPRILFKAELSSHRAQLSYFDLIMYRLKYLLLLVTSFLLGCGDEADSTTRTDDNNYFVAVEETASVSAETLKALASGFGQKQIAALLKYGVKSYKLTYATTYQGSPIHASGLLMVPTGITEAAPLISVQHGTTFVKDDAPSASSGYSGMELFASAGYIALMPDFIGYGESSEVFHPYYDKEHSALAVIDMIKAAKQFLTKEKVSLNEKLFLAGYSEGGYVTLAAAKEIETNPAHKLEVTAVAAGAGGYDLQQMLSGISTNSYYSYPSYLAFVLMSYNHTYNWNKPLNYFFADRYADTLQTYLNGEHEGWFINSRITTDLNKLFNPDFYSRLKEPSGEAELKRAIEKNSVGGWSTAIPMKLYHGTKDEIIPYSNSEATLKNFQAAGSKNISLTAIPNGTHGSSFVPMMQDFIPWFLTMK
jgi:pimeloyl-ACP methyl ester carboxylesterase